MLAFNLQLFGKKKSKVIQTDAKVPQATAEEKQLMNEALGYLQMNKPITEKLLGLANGSLGGQFTPNYQDIYNKLQIKDFLTAYSRMFSKQEMRYKMPIEGIWLIWVILLASIKKGTSILITNIGKLLIATELLCKDL